MGELLSLNDEQQICGETESPVPFFKTSVAETVCLKKTVMLLDS